MNGPGRSEPATFEFMKTHRYESVKSAFGILWDYDPVKGFGTSEIYRLDRDPKGTVEQSTGLNLEEMKSPMPLVRPVTIVVVEDDPGHARLIEKNVRKSHVTNEVVILDDGQKANDHLFCEGKYKDGVRPTPLPVILDPGLPVIDGFELLRRIKSHPLFRKVPVMVLTNPEEQQEISECYDLGCNVFITKRLEYDKFCEAIQGLGLFLAVVSLP